MQLGLRNWDCTLGRHEAETVEEGRRVPLASPDRRGERPAYYDDEDELRTRLEQAD